MNHFKLTDQQKQQISEIIGKDHIECIERACSDYLYLKDLYKISPKGKVNAKLKLIHDSAVQIAECLSDDSVKLQLSVMLQEHLTSDLKTIERFGGLGLGDLHMDLHLLIDATVSATEIKPGRPQGSNNRWGNHLAFTLYLCCLKAGHTPKNIKEGAHHVGILHKILDILREPLNIGAGEFNGIFAQTIEMRQKQ